MLLGTFKTVFNSVFLVPTKTNTLHRKQRERGEESERQMRGYTQIHGRSVFKHGICVVLVESVHANLVWSDRPPATTSPVDAI